MIIPGFWSSYSSAISSLLTGDYINWMKYCESIFPKVSKCTYQAFGPSGTIQSFDALCLLPLNVINQKLFIIVWVWYIIQLTLSVLNLIYWFIVSISEKIRIYILCKRALQTVSRKQMLHASCKAHLGHFFVLIQIAENTNPITFVELISDLTMNKTNSDQNGKL